MSYLDVDCDQVLRKDILDEEAVDVTIPVKFNGVVDLANSLTTEGSVQEHINKDENKPWPPAPYRITNFLLKNGDDTCKISFCIHDAT